MSKTAFISSRSAFDFLRRALNWLSKSAGSGNSDPVGAEFLFASRSRRTSLSSCGQAQGQGDREATLSTVPPDL
ncbi:hypothetical protein [Tychonema sp. LEGE 07203]|uniref:hypothetical protein n=1 Tax=Tychonema sp. LEGE 07203 TaxID=1828671 RepID=UPI00187E8642|nr:hypothetical protein [Tychonema sp. LEGE 07203]MBE9097172.1 hypothetical protein [Tychonema sp. LEGE 07203]